MPLLSFQRERPRDREQAKEAAGVDEEDVLGGAETAAFAEFVYHAVGGFG